MSDQKKKRLTEGEKFPKLPRIFKTKEPDETPEKETNSKNEEDVSE